MMSKSHDNLFKTTETVQNIEQIQEPDNFDANQTAAQQFPNDRRRSTLVSLSSSKYIELLGIRMFYLLFMIILIIIYHICFI